MVVVQRPPGQGLGIGPAAGEKRRGGLQRGAHGASAAGGRQMREIDVDGVPVGGEPLRSRSEVDRCGYPGLRPLKGRVIAEHPTLLLVTSGKHPFRK